jgi:hypothetical protein
LKPAESAGAQNDEDAVDQELAAWREEIRRHALAELTRRPAKPPRILRIGALVLLLLVHAVLLIGLRDAMRHGIAADETAIQVSWIDLAQPEPPLPQPPPQPAAAPQLAPSPRQASVPLAAMIAPSVESSVTAEPAFRAYNPDGSLNIPSDLAQHVARAQPAPSFRAALIETSPAMRHQRPLKVRPNHFAPAWVSEGSPINDFVMRHLSAEKEFRTPWGSKIVCQGVTVFVMMIGGCAWGFPPPHWSPTQSWKPASVLDEE